MENASKALIIAGAILISIVLIAVGVMVVNGANGAINQAINNMSDSEKQMFNSRFTSYEGNQKGSSVKALLNSIVTSNADEEAPVLVSVECSAKGVNPALNVSLKKGESDSNAIQTASNSISTCRSQLTNSGNYVVTFEYTGGVISKIIIKDKTTN